MNVEAFWKFPMLVVTSSEYDYIMLILSVVSCNIWKPLPTTEVEKEDKEKEKGNICVSWEEEGGIYYNNGAMVGDFFQQIHSLYATADVHIEKFFLCLNLNLFGCRILQENMFKTDYHRRFDVNAKSFLLLALFTIFSSLHTLVIHETAERNSWTLLSIF